MKTFWNQIMESLKGKNPGMVGGAIGLALALSLVIFGVLKTLFILVLTALGVFLGVRYFSNKEAIRNLLDRILPPGMFR
jgi:uncharacterized membrane protein